MDHSLREAHGLKHDFGDFSEELGRRRGDGLYVAIIAELPRLDVAQQLRTISLKNAFRGKVTT